jgi:hypothetical protein
MGIWTAVQYRALALMMYVLAVTIQNTRACHWAWFLVTSHSCHLLHAVPFLFFVYHEV